MAFQNQPGCGCCGSSQPSCPLTVKVIGCGVDSYRLDGVTVTVKDSTGTTTIGTCITGSDGTCVIGVPAAGTYKVSTNACTPASTSVNVTCPGGATVTLSSCVTITQSVQGCNPSFPNVVAVIENTSGWSGQNKAPGPGNYTFTLTGDPCWEDYGPVPFTLPSCANFTLPTVQMVPRRITMVVNVRGCIDLPLQGATVTLSDLNTGGAVFTQTQTTDASGNATFTDVPTFPIDGSGNCNSYSATATAPRFNPATINGVRTCIDGDTIATFGLSGANRLTAASGYQCTECCNFPIPNTLYATDAWGTIALVFTAGNGWQGCHLGPSATLNCGPQFPDNRGCTTDFTTGDLITTTDQPSAGYILKCPTTLWTLSQNYSACSFIDGQGVHHVYSTPGGCSADGLATGGACAGGSGVSAGGGAGDNQPCSGLLPPLSLTFNLPDGRPAGTVTISE